MRRTSPWRCGLFLAGLVVALIGAGRSRAQEEPPKGAEFSAEQIEFFEKEVRPLLVKRCYECHGDVGDELKGGLRVDSRQALLSGGDTGPAIDLETPDKSLLLDAIRYGETYQMPPKQKMPAEEIAIIEKWISQKAPWPAETGKSEGGAKKFDLAARKASHWAWQPVVEPPIPAVRDAAWPKSAIDRFILAKLEAAELKPSADADKRVLIRRLYYDLLGLPPPPERVTEFLKDERPDAIERLVDELLKSPQFGERWGRHWLDVVAYAETRGHEFDYDMPGVALYRDYVIQAFNDDLPFDQFAKEHIAGDLIDRRGPKGEHESAVATGFWFLGEWLHSPVDIRKDETDRFDRMIDVYSKGFLGLTVACARCHDHKFDAISQKDYYALSGFLQSFEYRQYRFETSALELAAAKELDEASKALQAPMRELAIRSYRAALEEAAPYLTAALQAEDAANDSADGAKLDANRLGAWKKELEGTRFVAKDAPVNKASSNHCRVIEEFADASASLLQDGAAYGLHPEPVGAVLLSADPAQPFAGVREMGSATFKSPFAKLTLASQSTRDAGALGGTVRSGKTLRTKTFALQSPVLYYLVRGAGRAFAAVDSHRMVNGPLHGGLLRGFEAAKENEWQWVRHELKDYVGHNLHIEFSPDKEGDFEIALVAEANEPPFELSEPAPPWKRSAPAEFRAALLEALDAWASGKLSSRQASDLNAILNRRDLFSMNEKAEDPLQAQVNAFKKVEKEWTERLAAPSRTVMAAWEGSPVDDDLLVRGNAHVRGGVVPRAFLTAIQTESGAAASGASRLDLAKCTVAAGNPLFARVAVNRVWHYLFGKGIVPTVDNFGVLGLPPSHPELLDYLAVEFARDGHSIKRLIKKIVLSRTYRQSSRHEASTDAKDPNNLLLHRMNLRRRDAEGIRDGVLALSGQLDLRAPLAESIPVHLTQYMEGRGRPGTSGPLDGAAKRSVYQAVRRNFMPPFLTVFDFPPPAAPFGARNQSNVPAQALALLNDPFVHDQAKKWAESLMAREGTFEARIDSVYQRGLSRNATPEEIAEWKAFFAEQGSLLGLDAAKSESDARVWADLCHLIYNSKEFLFVE